MIPPKLKFPTKHQQTQLTNAQLICAVKGSKKPYGVLNQSLPKIAWPEQYELTAELNLPLFAYVLKASPPNCHRSLNAPTKKSRTSWVLVLRRIHTYKFASIISIS